MMNEQRYKVIYNEDGEGAQISDEVKEEWVFAEDCADLLNSQDERIAELEQNLGLIKLGIEQQHKQLISCETALDERNDKVSLQAARIAELEKELNQKSLYFVGYTNGNQIAYAKEDQGSFYVNTDNDCYIPVYMLAVHLHRLGGTASEEWMTSLQDKQLREGVNHE